MGLFDIFKKKDKTYICARCKKETTDAESNWIGNHRFCSDCAAPPKETISPKQAVDNFITTKTMKANTISTALQKEAEEAGYQAYMDYAKGSLTPEEAYQKRGFVKDEDGIWVYGKLTPKDSDSHMKERKNESLMVCNNYDPKTLFTTNDLLAKAYVNDNEQIKVLQNCNAIIIDIDRRASGPEREINVLLYDKDIGYFCVRQSSGAYSGLGLWYYVLPKNISNPKIENYIDDYEHFICIPNEWFSKEFELDIHGNRRMSCGERIKRHTP